MGIKVYKSESRGGGKQGWLDTKHSFSFADYYDPERMGFGKLRVLNEDIVAPGKGFGMHPHENMEVVTLVLEGALEHKDSMGNAGVIPAGMMQRMSVGTGVMHSEYNHAKTKSVHLLQIWVEPKILDVRPSYEDKEIMQRGIKDVLFPVVSGKKLPNSLLINQDSVFYLGLLSSGKKASCKIIKGHGAFVFLVSGKLEVGGKTLESGDAAEITEAPEVEITPLEKSYVLVIDVPMG